MSISTRVQIDRRAGRFPRTLGRALILSLSVAVACGGAGGRADSSSGSGGAAAGGAIVGGAPSAGGSSASGGTGIGGVSIGGGTGGAAVGGSSTGGAAVIGAGGAEVSGGATGAGGESESDACSMASELDAEFPECFVLTVSNPIDAARADAFLSVRVADIVASHSDFNPNAFVIFDAMMELSSQSIDEQPDDEADAIGFVVQLAALETKQVTVRYATSGTKIRDYPKRAQALVSAKAGGSWSGTTYTGGSYADTDFLDVTGHIDHDYDYLRFEGPGWESDRIGHRIYLDRRNGIDIFGKKLPVMILEDIDYTNEDYSTMSDWGMDILKVGEALGLGSPGTWENGAPVKLANIQALSVRILESGPIYALLRMSYGGWQTAAGTIDITADISIAAGSRVTKIVLGIDGSIPNICAGLIKHADTALLTPPVTSGHTYLAHYGKQSLVPDNLGMGILYRSADQLELVESPADHLAVLKPTEGRLTYYLTGAWVQEGDGLASEQEFKNFLDATIREMDSPIAITIH